MIVFHSDLDNTMIFSYKHDIGSDKKNVEIYQGREVSFITEKTFQLLEELKDKVLFVPTTTRTVGQYKRIDLGIGTPSYALVCNGGVLLADGNEDETWYQESLQLVSGSREIMLQAIKLLEKEPKRTIEIQFIRELFVFTKCDEPEKTVKHLQETLDLMLVDVFHHGPKIYVVPKTLSKGKALKRFRKYIKADCVIAAGDSELDIPMFGEADVAIAPQKLAQKADLPKQTVCMSEDKVYSEEILEYIRKLVRMK